MPVSFAFSVGVLKDQLAALDVACIQKIYMDIRVRSMDVRRALSTRSTRSDATRAAVCVARAESDTSGATSEPVNNVDNMRYLSDSLGAYHEISITMKVFKKEADLESNFVFERSQHSWSNFTCFACSPIYKNRVSCQLPIPSQVFKALS